MSCATSSHSENERCRKSTITNPKYRFPSSCWTCQYPCGCGSAVNDAHIHTNCLLLDISWLAWICWSRTETLFLRHRTSLSMLLFSLFFGFGDTFIHKGFFKMIKIINFRGDLTDISATKEALIPLFAPLQIHLMLTFFLRQLHEYYLHTINAGTR